MSRGEKLSPGFLISHQVEDIFPSKKERERFNYEPFDLFVTAGLPKDEPLNSRLMLGAEDADELTERIEDDIYLVFRYKHEEFDPESMAGIPWGAEEVPVFQREFYPASMTPDEDFHILSEILESAVEEVTEASYMYNADVRNMNGEVARCRKMGEYMSKISGGKLTAFPETYGISEIGINPAGFEAHFVQYSQEVRPADTESEEKIHLNYEEREIDEIEERLKQEGFDVTKDTLPPNISPYDLE